MKHLLRSQSEERLCPALGQLLFLPPHPPAFCRPLGCCSLPAPTPWWSEASGSGRNTPRWELPSSCWERLWTWGDTNSRLARNVLIASLLIIAPSLAYLSLKPLASTPANMSEPISDVSTTKGASFILENLAFFERQREKHDVTSNMQSNGMWQLQTALERWISEVWVLITCRLQYLHLVVGLLQAPDGI